MTKTWFGLLVALILVAGCSNDADTTAPNADNVSEAPPLPELQGNVEAQIASWDEIADAIASHKGKVVVVDLWSTWCEPCLEEFPNLVNLKRKHQDKLVTLSVNMNYAGLEDETPESLKPEVLKILEEQGAKFPNYISSTPDEEVYQKLDIVGLPAVHVYDASGKLVKKFGNDGEFTYEKDVTPFVEKLLADKQVAANN